MPCQARRNVSVKPLSSSDLEACLNSLETQTRHRAYDLYCTRGSRHGTALGDWLAAEQEGAAAPLAGIAEHANDIRVTAFVPCAQVNDLVVDALPHEIVVEADRDGRVERFSRFRMPAPIDANRVKARLCGCRLNVIAPKTGQAA